MRWTLALVVVAVVGCGRVRRRRGVCRPTVAVVNDAGPTPICAPAPATREDAPEPPAVVGVPTFTNPRLEMGVLRAPPSMSTVNTRIPLLRWELDVLDPEVRVDLCRDPACANPRITAVVTTDRYRPPGPLDAGVWFWRVTVLEAPSRRTPVWHFVVGRNPPGVDTAWVRPQRACDLNGDGRSDLLEDPIDHVPEEDELNEIRWRWGQLDGFGPVHSTGEVIRYLIPQNPECVPDVLGTGRSAFFVGSIGRSTGADHRTALYSWVPVFRPSRNLTVLSPRNGRGKESVHAEGETSSPHARAEARGTP